MAGDTEQLFDLLNESDYEKLPLKKALTKDIYEELKFKTTKFGGTLGDCIRSGCKNPVQTGIGMRACDPEAYTTFAPLIDRIIKDYHKTDHVQHPSIDFGYEDDDDVDLNFDDVDPYGAFIKSTRVRVARSLEGFGFHPVMTLQDRLDLERTICNALNQLQGELRGVYLPITRMSRETQTQLVDDHLLFHNYNKITESAGGFRDWPLGRGIFLNQEKTFLVWVGEEDHIRIISIQPGNDLRAVYKRLVKGVRCLKETGLNWIRNDRLGYVTFCPTNLGTTLRASVHVDIPMLSKSAHFLEFCANHKLQVRGFHGDGSSLSGTVFDISNNRRLGLTEIQAVHEMREGVKAVIEEEKRLQKRI